MNPEYINQQQSNQHDAPFQNFEGGHVGSAAASFSKGPPRIGTPINNNANTHPVSVNNYLGPNQQKPSMPFNQEVLNSYPSLDNQRPNFETNNSKPFANNLISGNVGQNEPKYISAQNGATQISNHPDNKHETNNLSQRNASSMPPVMRQPGNFMQSNAQGQTFNQQIGQNQQPPHTLNGKTQQPNVQTSFSGHPQPPFPLHLNPSSSETSLIGQPPLTGQPSLIGQSYLQTAQPSLPTQSSAQTTLPSQLPLQSLPGQPSLVNQSLPGRPPLPIQPPSLNQTLPGQVPSLNQALPGQPPLINKTLTSQPPSVNQTLPGQPPQVKQSLPGKPILTNQSLSGQPPIPGQPPVTSSNFSVQPPLLPGQPQSFGQTPLGAQNSLSRQPLMPNQPALPNQPASFGRPPMPGHSYQPQSNHQQFDHGKPPVPGNITNQMQNMSLSGIPRYPPTPANGPAGFPSSGQPHMPVNSGQSHMPMNSGPPHMPMHSGQPHMPQQHMGMNSSQMGGMNAYPPMSGQQPMGPQQSYGQPGYGPPGYQQPNQPMKKLDPDQMPNPIQVTQSDQKERFGPFYTNQIGHLPPLVTTSFVVKDQGNTSPRFIRSSMYSVPITQDIMKNTQIPFSLVISPMARLVEQESPIPIVNFGALGPVRCIRCKAYMCPFMNFVDSGRRFQCVFCKATTDVPAEYFQHLDHTGQRMDRFERPELVLGTYEFFATAEYCRNNSLPKPPAFIFVIDVSYNSIKSGLVHLLCQNMKQILQNLPVDEGCTSSNMRVGFITFDSTVHFYNIKGTLAAPQILVVGDTQDMFMPLLDGFLATPEESEAIIDALMEQIPNMFGQTKETETVLLPAIVAGLEALKASDCSGKLLVFNSSLPSAEAPGKLKNRDDRKLLGTDKERTILNPQNQVYNQVGQDCVQAGCSVDLFLLNNSYIDVATIGQVSRLSGGEVYKYTYFQADIDGDRLIGDLILDISRPIAFDAIMRVRTSTGIRPTDFYGHFFMSNTTDVELASIDCDKAIAVEIKHDDKLQEGDGVYIQTALLYTSSSGQRRLRIFNLSLKTCSQMADLYRSCELDSLINYLSKQTVFKLLDNNPKAVKDALVNRAAHILAAYRKHCAAPSSAGQLILPDCMKLLPLYINGILKSDAISGGSDMTVDDRSYVMQTVLMMDVPTSVNYFYPRLLPLHEVEITEKEITIPEPIRVSLEKMNERGVYLLENGIHMLMWVGLGSDPEFIQKIFGVPNASQINIEQNKLPELDNPTSNALRNLIEEIRIQRHRFMRLTLVRQGEKLEAVYKHFLVEDRGTDGSPSYVDFLCHMHKEIRSILS